MFEQDIAGSKVFFKLLCANSDCWNYFAVLYRH